MAPARKRSKLANDNETVPAPAETAPDNQWAKDTNTLSKQATGKDGAGKAPLRVDTVENNAETAGGHATPAKSSPAQSQPQANGQNRGSWYTSAWRSKAGPVAQASRETISVDKGVSSESSYHGDQGNRRPSGSASVSKSFKGSSRKSIPLAAEATRVHAVGDAVSVPKQRKKLSADEKGASKEKQSSEASKEERKPDIVEEEAPQLSPTEPSMVADDDARTETASVRQSSGSWFGWWSRPDDYGGDNEAPKNGSKAAFDVAAEQGSSVLTTATSKDTTNDAPPIPPQETNEEEVAFGQLKPETSVKTGSTRSWFGLWSKTQNQQAEAEEQQRNQDKQRAEQEAEPQPEQLPAPEVNVSAGAGQTTEDVKVVASSLPKDGDERPKSSGWAFWSTDKPKGTAQGAEDSSKQIGELAVADTPSQSHPEAAQYNQQPESKSEMKRNGSLLRRKRGRPESKDVSGETTAAGTPTGSHTQTPVGTQFHTPLDTPEGSPAPVQRGKKPQLRPNLISPSFRETYPLAMSLSYLDKLTQVIGQTLRLTQAPKAACHPLIAQQSHKVRKAIAIGVHGFFPAVLLQRVLGQPTGTSIRFANYAASSIKHWCQQHQPDLKNVEVEQIALEGEGLVADRVNTLWKLLLNWTSHLRQADFVLIACHSQGVPVAIMLMAKLIQLGILSPHARIGVCAMAGINLGPFLDYKSRFFGGSAAELFDFSDSKSKVSMAYADSLEICLRYGVRITFVGGLDDQLVSLESSLYTPLTHPYVSRAIFVDGRLHTSNFLIHLVTFAAKLRNLGVSDHGLIREISAPLAGSIVGGEGHSRVYDDPAVYRTAIEFALESTDVATSAFASLQSATADQTRKSMEENASRRGSLAGYPSNMTAANHMRRGSLSSISLAPSGMAPVIARFEAPGAVGSAEKNPHILPWAVRGMLEEYLVKNDPKLRAEVQELVKEFEDWKPTSKVLKEVKWRLEGVRSMM